MSVGKKKQVAEYKAMRVAPNGRDCWWVEACDLKTGDPYSYTLKADKAMLMTAAQLKRWQKHMRDSNHKNYRTYGPSTITVPT